MASFELTKIKSSKCPMSEVEGHIIPQLHHGPIYPLPNFAFCYLRHTLLSCKVYNRIRRYFRSGGEAEACSLGKFLKLDV